MKLTQKQSEIVLAVGTGELGTMWHESLPFARIVDSAMRELSEGLTTARLPILGDDRMAVVEAVIAEHVSACAVAFYGDPKVFEQAKEYAAS